MKSKRSREIRVRQWRLLHALSGHRAGLTIAELVARLSVARATVYRDLEELAEAGVPLVSDTGSGRARHRLLRQAELPPIGLNGLQVAALHLARQELEPLAGTGLVAELDALLAALRPPSPQRTFNFAERPPGHPRVLKTIESAMNARRRARIEYRSASRGGNRSVVHVEPLLLNVADGDPYLLAYCVERGGMRTYKLARIQSAKLTDQPSVHRATTNDCETFGNSLKAWTGTPELVRVRLDADVAWLAEEYRLPNQTLHPEPDGGVVVEARLAGLVEARRWILSWGGVAEALHPPALRAATQADLAQALAKYDGPGPTKARRKKSLDRQAGVSPKAETRVG